MCILLSPLFHRQVPPPLPRCPGTSMCRQAGEGAKQRCNRLNKHSVVRRCQNLGVVWVGDMLWCIILSITCVGGWHGDQRDPDPPRSRRAAHVRPDGTQVARMQSLPDIYDGCRKRWSWVLAPINWDRGWALGMDWSLSREMLVFLEPEVRLWGLLGLL